MMDAVTRSDLQALLAVETQPAISIYLPTHPVGREGEKDLLRLTQLIDQAEERVAQAGGGAVDARKLVAPLRELANDTAFWGHRGKGLAIFLSPDVFKWFRLPHQFDSHLTVGTRFQIMPLLSLLSQDDRFLLLTLSQHRVHLYEGDRYRLTLREVPQLPTNLQSALNEVSVDRGSKQMHSAGVDPARHHATIYHGHGGKPDTHKEELRDFFRAIDEALHPVLRGERRPLFLAGVDYELPIYRKVNTYTGLAQQHLEANCDYLTLHQLHELVWPVVQQELAATRAAEIDELYESAGGARRESDIGSILAASHAGRVEGLWIDRQETLSGVFDPVEGKVQVNPNGALGGEDLMNLAATNTLLHGGKVFVLDQEQMPNRDKMMAVLRY